MDDLGLPLKFSETIISIHIPIFCVQKDHTHLRCLIRSPTICWQAELCGSGLDPTRNGLRCQGCTMWMSLFLRHNTAKPMLLMLMLQCRQDRLITGSACHWHNVTGCEIGSRASMVRSLEDLLQGPCPFQQPRPVASDSSAVRWGTGERGNGRRSRAKARLSQGPVQGYRPTHLDTKNPCHTFVFQEFVLNKSQRKNNWATLRLKTLLLKNSRKFSERPRSKPPDHLGATQLIDRNVSRFFFKSYSQWSWSTDLWSFMFIWIKWKKIAWHFKMIIHEHVPGIEFWANLRPGPWPLAPWPFWPRRRKWVVVLQRKLPRCDPQISCFWWCGPGEWSAMMCNVDIISY